MGSVFMWAEPFCGRTPAPAVLFLQWATSDRFFEGGPSRQVLSQHRGLWKGVAIGRLLIVVSERKAPDFA